MARTFRIGVIGYSAQAFDENDARLILRRALEGHALAGRCEVVSGLTNLGVPRIAYEEAVKLGLRTVGIACKKATEHECFPCDEVVIIGEEWGDESPTFLASIDVLIRVGGGKQSASEAFTGPKRYYPLDALSTGQPTS